jgi:hypothetical protein
VRVFYAEHPGIFCEVAVFATPIILPGQSFSPANLDGIDILKSYSPMPVFAGDKVNPQLFSVEESGREDVFGFYRYDYLFC